MTAAIVTLVAGVVLGYLGQRSRMCFVGGIRDFMLVRDTSLLRGLAAFGLTAWLAFPVMAAHSNGAPFVLFSAMMLVQLVVVWRFYPETII